MIPKEITCLCGNKIKLDQDKALIYNGENLYFRWVCDKCFDTYQYKVKLYAISQSKSAQVDARQQAGDGPALGNGNTQRKKTAKKS